MNRYSFRRRTFLRVGFFIGLGLITGCSPLSVINGLTPSDTYQAKNGIPYGKLERQQLDVYVPAKGADNAPVVVFFYGGSWNSGERGDYLFVGEALAERGFVTVIADYRLYPEVRYPDFLDDCALAVRWALAHIGEYGGDTRRVFLMGHSAGGYNAAMLALNPQYLNHAGVKVNDIRGLITLAGPFDFLPLQARVTRAVFGYPDTSRMTQPIEYVTAAAPPALLLTGSDDDIVDPANSVRLAARLRSVGGSVKEVVYPKLGHRLLVGALASPLRSTAPVLDDVAAFINETGDNSTDATLTSKAEPSR
jgi:acetyl esterase/lipase